MDARCPIRTWVCSVDGYPPVDVTATTRGAAMWRVFQWYRAAHDSARFLDFLRIARLRSVPNPRGVGRRIRLRSGTLGWTCMGASGLVLPEAVFYVPDGERHARLSHPRDVEYLDEKELSA